MHRRNFLTGLGLTAVAWPTAARAQQPAIPVIGFLSGASPNDAFAGALAGFRKGLAENGFTEGVNVAIEYRWADGHYEQLASMAHGLVRQNVSVIFASASNLGIQAAEAATSAIPIVFTTASDPVESGLVSSINHPAGNVTGLNLMFYVVEAKRLELLHELVPKATTVRVFPHRSGSPTAILNERNVRKAADEMGLRLDFVDAHSEKDIDTAFQTLAEKQIGGIFITSEPYLASQTQRIAELTVRYQVPASSSLREFAAAGGLMSYGANLAEFYRQAGIYVAKVLKGAKPGDLPVLQPTKFDFSINLKTAKALGLSVPQTLLVAADEVIE